MVKLIFFINHQKRLLSLEPNPLSGSFYNTTLFWSRWVCAAD